MIELDFANSTYAFDAALSLLIFREKWMMGHSRPFSLYPSIYVFIYIPDNICYNNSPIN